MLIRAPSAADLPAIGAMWNAMIRDTAATFTSTLKTDDDLHALLAQRPDSFLVAETSGTCAGFITWGAFRAGDGYAHTAEHSIVTATQGHGIGTALMQTALAQAEAQGIHVMVACIGGENTRAVAFHERLGFAKAGQLPKVGRKMGRWYDLILMSRVTSSS